VLFWHTQLNFQQSENARNQPAALSARLCKDKLRASSGKTHRKAVCPPVQRQTSRLAIAAIAA